MKKTRWIMATLILLALTTAILGVDGCKKAEPAQQAEPAQGSGTQTHQYTCSMHPEVVQDKPGKCPKCGMELVEKH